jgi:hypothetical protein
VEWRELFLQNLSGGTKMAWAILGKKNLRQKRDRREDLEAKVFDRSTLRTSGREERRWSIFRL